MGSIPAIECLGALKNVVALGAGLCDGLECGGNTKAAIMRIGFCEMRKFVRKFFPSSNEQVYWESCGLADLITTCYGGRNRKCAEIYARTLKPMHEIEKEQLNGQMLQGYGTLKEVFEVLKSHNLVLEFPLIRQLHLIFYEGCSPASLLEI